MKKLLTLALTLLTLNAPNALAIGQITIFPFEMKDLVFFYTMEKDPAFILGILKTSEKHWKDLGQTTRCNQNRTLIGVYTNPVGGLITRSGLVTSLARTTSIRSIYSDSKKSVYKVAYRNVNYMMEIWYLKDTHIAAFTCPVM